MNFRHASTNFKEKSGGKRIRQMKVDDKGTKSNDVMESKIGTKRLKEEHTFDKNEVDGNGEVTGQIITQIKEKFKCIDEKIDMIQLKFDLQIKEAQRIREPSHRFMK